MARLVICDDESHITEIITRFFRKKGHEVFGTTNGEEALQHVLDKSADLLITDIAMKGLSGLDLLLKMKEAGSDVPVIITTGNPSHHSAVEALRGGAFDYVVKPFHLDEIAERAEKALSAKRVKDENLLYSKLVSLLFEGAGYEAKGERVSSIPGLETAARVLEDFQENFDGSGRPGVCGGIRYPRWRGCRRWRMPTCRCDRPGRTGER